MGQTNKIFMRATGAAAIASSLTTDGVFVIESVRLHLSAAGGAAEDFSVTINSGVGAAYDVELHAQDMNAVTDDVWIPAQPIAVDDGDVIDFAWVNTNTKTWGLEVVYRKSV